jgi:hypothetical protein
MNPQAMVTVSYFMLLEVRPIGRRKANILAVRNDPDYQEEVRLLLQNGAREYATKLINLGFSWNCLAQF